MHFQVRQKFFFFVRMYQYSSGCYGEVCTMAPLMTPHALPKSQMLQRYINNFHKMQLLAMATWTKCIVVRLQPQPTSLAVALPFTGPANCVPLIAWQWINIQTKQTRILGLHFVSNVSKKTSSYSTSTRPVPRQCYQSCTDSLRRDAKTLQRLRAGQDQHQEGRDQFVLGEEKTPFSFLENSFRLTIAHWLYYPWTNACTSSR